MKKVRKITFQHSLVNVLNEGSDEQIKSVLIPENRIIVTYFNMDNDNDVIDGMIKENHDKETFSASFNQKDLSSANPNKYDLTTVGSKELLEALLLNVENSINKI